MKIHTKLIYLIITLCAVVGVITARLFYLQIYANQAYYTLGQKNFLREEIITPPRGNILDHEGHLLATNRPVTNVYWKGSGKRHLQPSQLATLEHLAGILKKEWSEGFMQELRATERTARTMLIASDIDHVMLSQILEAFAFDPHLEINTHFKRHYPYRTWACHILGYISAFDLQAQGKMGLEKILEDTLKGEHGTLIRTINSFGMSIKEEEFKAALNGQDIVTTIDLTLQTIAEQLFPEEYRGALVVMNPKTGAIKALVSRPAFDPEMFLESIPTHLWEEVQQKKPFLNRAFDACYPPASIFKLVTISAALEKHIIDPDTCWYCDGYLAYHGRKYNCKGSKSHGNMNAREALSQSCNVFFYRIAKRMAIDTLADYAARFGLGRTTNVLFPEKAGLVPTRAWKLATKGERWWPGETLSAVIGQSFLLVTPLQITRMIAAIFEGYLVKPRILEQEEIEQEPLDISRSTRLFLQDAMKLVVSEGSGKQLNNMSNLTIYGKTGTAQTCALDHEGNQTLEHGWFVAYFKYKNHEPLAMVIFVEHAGTSSVPTGVAKRYLIKYRKYMELRDQGYTDIDPVTLTTGRSWTLTPTATPLPSFFFSTGTQVGEISNAHE